jgi:hypothetical protein
MPRGGRSLLLLAFSLTGAAFAAAWATDNLVGLWARFGVISMQPSFADMRAHTSGWECMRAGIDIAVVNPCDPWGRAIGPAGIIDSLAFVGLGEGSTVPLALLMIGLFAASVVVVAGPISRREALVYGAIVFSPSVMLGVERGNTDLLIFSLLTVVLVTMRRTNSWLRACSWAALLLASLIKLYPIFALGVFLRQSARRALLACAAVLAPFAAYLLLNLDDFAGIDRTFSRAVWSSYGAGVAVDSLQESLDFGESIATSASVLVLLAGFILSLTLAFGLRRAGFVEAYAENDVRSLDAFWIGASIYVGTYAIGHNYDYKLVFLVFVVPLLLRLSKSSEASFPLARLALASVVATLWLSGPNPIVPGLSDAWLEAQDTFAFEELLNWLLVVYLAALLVLTLPAWLAPWPARDRRPHETLGHPARLPVGKA